MQCIIGTIPPCYVAGLWNKVFLCSNLSLFIFLPFTYLFMESSGFSGSRQVNMLTVL